MKQWWRRVRPYILSSIIFGLARLIGLTLRLKSVGWERYRDNDGARIYCGWHGRSMIPANFFKDRGVFVIISHSRDGEMQNRIFRKFGFNVIRGSTGRGGERALIESIRELRKGSELAITPDGPRGPSGVAQEGVLMMARKSGCQLVAVGSSASRATYVNSWDRYMVPWFFARAVFVFGDPILVPKDADPEMVEEIRKKLEVEINRVQDEADRMMGAKPPPPKRKAS